MPTPTIALPESEQTIEVSEGRNSASEVAVNKTPTRTQSWVDSSQRQAAQRGHVESIGDAKLVGTVKQNIDGPIKTKDLLEISGKSQDLLEVSAEQKAKTKTDTRRIEVLTGQRQGQVAFVQFGELENIRKVSHFALLNKDVTTSTKEELEKLDAVDVIREWSNFWEVRVLSRRGVSEITKLNETRVPLGTLFSESNLAGEATEFKLEEQVATEKSKWKRDVSFRSLTDDALRIKEEDLRSWIKWGEYGHIDSTKGVAVRIQGGRSSDPDSLLREDQNIGEVENQKAGENVLAASRGSEGGHEDEGAAQWLYELRRDTGDFFDPGSTLADWLAGTPGARGRKLLYPPYPPILYVAVFIPGPFVGLRVEAKLTAGIYVTASLNVNTEAVKRCMANQLELETLRSLSRGEVTQQQIDLKRDEVNRARSRLEIGVTLKGAVDGDIGGEVLLGISAGLSGLNVTAGISGSIEAEVKGGEAEILGVLKRTRDRWIPDLRASFDFEALLSAACRAKLTYQLLFWGGDLFSLKLGKWPLARAWVHTDFPLHGDKLRHARENLTHEFRWRPPSLTLISRRAVESALLRDIAQLPVYRKEIVRLKAEREELRQKSGHGAIRAEERAKNRLEKLERVVAEIEKTDLPDGKLSETTPELLELSREELVQAGTRLLQAKIALQKSLDLESRFTKLKGDSPANDFASYVTNRRLIAQSPFQAKNTVHETKKRLDWASTEIQMLDYKDAIDQESGSGKKKWDAYQSAQKELDIAKAASAKQVEQLTEAKDRVLEYEKKCRKDKRDAPKELYENHVTGLANARKSYVRLVAEHAEAERQWREYDFKLATRAKDQKLGPLFKTRAQQIDRVVELTKNLSRTGTEEHELKVLLKSLADWARGNSFWMSHVERLSADARASAFGALAPLPPLTVPGSDAKAK